MLYNFYIIFETLQIIIYDFTFFAIFKYNFWNNKIVTWHFDLFCKIEFIILIIVSIKIKKLWYNVPN